MSLHTLERYVAILECYVASHPEQWYCFYPFWEDPSREETERRGDEDATRGRGDAATRGS